MSKTFKLGQPAPISGEFGIVGPRAFPRLTAPVSSNRRPIRLPRRARRARVSR